MDRLYQNFAQATGASIEQVKSEILRITHPYLLFQQGRLDKSGYFKTIRALFRQELGDETLEQAHCDMFSLNNQLVQFIRSLNGDYCYSIISNTDELHFNFILEKYDELDLFVKNTTSYETGFLKPDKKIYQAALIKNKVRPEQCLFVDDRPENVDGAERLGIRSLQFHSVAQLLKDFNQLGILTIT